MLSTLTTKLYLTVNSGVSGYKRTATRTKTWRLKQCSVSLVRIRTQVNNSNLNSNFQSLDKNYSQGKLEYHNLSPPNAAIWEIKLSLIKYFKWLQSMESPKSWFVFFFFIFFMSYRWGFEYANSISLQRAKNPKRGFLGMTLKYMWWWGSSSGVSLMCGVIIHCHYSQLHSGPEWLYVLGSYLCA